MAYNYCLKNAQQEILDRLVRLLPDGTADEIVDAALSSYEGVCLAIMRQEKEIPDEA